MIADRKVEEIIYYCCPKCYACYSVLAVDKQMKCARCGAKLEERKEQTAWLSTKQEMIDNG